MHSFEKYNSIIIQFKNYNVNQNCTLGIELRVTTDVVDKETFILFPHFDEVLGIVAIAPFRA